MSNWAQINIQESGSPTIQLLSLFHDYSLAIILAILTFVTGISLFITTNMLVSDSQIITIVEVVWTVIPVTILLLLVVPSLQILYYIEETDPHITINTTGHQWFWSYEYMDLENNFESYIVQQPTTGEYRLLESDHRVVLPTNSHTRSLITAADVLHCWTIPALGVNADAVPGRLNQLFFTVLRPSILYGQCSEICGANHSFIPITIEAYHHNIFFNWLSWTDFSLQENNANAFMFINSHSEISWYLISENSNEK